MIDRALVVVSRTPLPKEVKADLVPPLTHEEAAELHASMLFDTVERAALHLHAQPYVYFDPADARMDFEHVFRHASFELKLKPTGGAKLSEKIGNAVENVFSDGVKKLIYLDVDAAVVPLQQIRLGFDESAKYINSPETAVYLKRKTLFGIYQARDTIIEKDAAILVEGYADLIALHQSGIRNVVASSGTALTVDQITYISRYTKNVYLVYDADTAGQEASLRGADILLEQGMNVFIVELPAGEDPDTFVLSRGADEFMVLIQNAMNVVEFKALLLGKKGSSTSDQVAMIQSIVDSLAKVDDAIKVNVLVKDLVGKFGLREEAIYTELKKKRSRVHKAVEPQADTTQKPAPVSLPPADRDLISLLSNIEDPLMNVIANEIASLDITNPVSKEIIELLLEARKLGEPPSSVIDQLSAEEVRRVFAELTFALPQRSKVWWEEIRPGSETPDYLKWISQVLISFELEQIEQGLKLMSGKIMDAEKRGILTGEFDARYQELVERKRVLTETYRDKEKREQYFGSLKGT